jgi:hypothetical protein
MVEYKVLTQRDSRFLGKFDPDVLASVLNGYAAEGWRVVQSFLTASLWKRSKADSGHRGARTQLNQMVPAAGSLFLSEASPRRWWPPWCSNWSRRSVSAWTSRWRGGCQVRLSPATSLPCGGCSTTAADCSTRATIRPEDGADRAAAVDPPGRKSRRGTASDKGSSLGQAVRQSLHRS